MHGMLPQSTDSLSVWEMWEMHPASCDLPVSQYDNMSTYKYTYTYIHTLIITRWKIPFDQSVGNNGTTVRQLFANVKRQLCVANLSFVVTVNFSSHHVGKFHYAPLSVAYASIPCYKFSKFMHLHVAAINDGWS